MTDSAAPPTRPRRRQALLWGAGVAAALAGAGLAWWRSGGSESAGGAPAADFWALSFAKPDGGTLDLGGLRGRPLLVNFWATWCPPCVEELPLLDRFFSENAANGWQVIGLAIDQPSAVRSFLGKTPVRFPVGLAGLSGTELGRSLGNLSGGLPFTVVLRGDGRIAHRKMGRVLPADLDAWRALR